MELTRVRGGGTEHATGVAAPGGDTELLALLLGGNETTAPAFPATLEAALAGGELAEDPMAVGDADGDGTGEGGDGETGTVDRALAAALALGAALAGANVPEAAPQSATGDAAGLATGGTANDGTLASTLTPATLLATRNGADATAASPATTEAASQPTSDAENEAAAADTAPGDDAATTVTTEGAQAKTVAPAAVDGGAAASAPSDPHLGDPKPVAKPVDGTAAAHGAEARIAHAEAPSFSSGAAEHHGLDLGSSDRRGATLASETPASSATSSAGTMASPEAATSLRVENVDAGSMSTVTATQVPATPTTSHDTAVVHGERPAHHPGAIEPRWGERVADALRLSAVRGGGEIRLRLEPEGLGHIDVRLHVQGDGVRAVIVAEHDSTRALLTSQQHVLHEALERSDLRLSGFTVDVGSGGGAASFAPPDADGRGPRPGAKAPPATSTSVSVAEAEPPSALAASGRVNVRV